jgi:hypothetical protein
VTFKILAIAALIVAGLSAGSAYAQTEAQRKVLQSPSIPKGRACMTNLEAAGTSAGFETFKAAKNHLLVMHPTAEELRPLQKSLYDCLDAAFPKNEVITVPVGTPQPAKPGTKSRVWYDTVEGYYIACASNGYANREQIERLGGVGPKSVYFGVQLTCEINDKILGWYKP